MPKELFPFRYRHELTGKWVRARYLAERHEIAERYKKWEITGPPKIRDGGAWGAGFQPYRDTEKAAPIGRCGATPLPGDERYLVLRGYVTYCAR